LDEQSKLIEQLKHVLNASASEMDRRINEQKAKAEKAQKQLTQQLGECTSKMAVMEKEIGLYKDRLQQLKAASSKSGLHHVTPVGNNSAAATAAHNDSNQFVDMDSSSFLADKHKSASALNMNSNNSGGGGGFFLKNNGSATNLHTESNMEWDSAAAVEKSKSTTSTISQSSVRTVKVSRRDLRRLNEDEVVQRSVRKDQN
jgi:uncharacterized protein